jgi:hypothetical protein
VTPDEVAGASSAATEPGADDIYALALQLAVTGHSLSEAAETVRKRAGGDEAPIELALTLAEDGCRDAPLDLAARQAMYVLGRALLTESS